MLNVVLIFRDGIAHKIRIEDDDLKVAQDILGEILTTLAEGNRDFEFRNDENELVFVANLDNVLHAYIEQKEKTE